MAEQCTLAHLGLSLHPQVPNADAAKLGSRERPSITQLDALAQPVACAEKTTPTGRGIRRLRHMTISCLYFSLERKPCPKSPIPVGSILTMAWFESSQGVLHKVAAACVPFISQLDVRFSIPSWQYLHCLCHTLFFAFGLSQRCAACCATSRWLFWQVPPWRHPHLDAVMRLLHGLLIYKGWCWMKHLLNGRTLRLDGQHIQRPHSMNCFYPIPSRTFLWP